MGKYFVKQAVEVEVIWVIEAEDADAALEDAYGSFNDKAIVDIIPLSWDKPWDTEEATDVFAVMTEEQLKPWREVGII